MQPENDHALNHDHAQACCRGKLTPLLGDVRRARGSTTDRVDRKQEPQHPQYPLERLCTHRSESSQMSFALRAQQLLLERNDVDLVASHRGLTIRAETEEVINSTLEVLKDFYRAKMTVGPPAIRYHNGLTLEEPWMGLRIRCAAEHLETIQADLVSRDARSIACERGSALALIQVCAPLAHLIGYGSILEQMTSGSAKHVMWLDHYAPVDNGCPGGSAA
jgi:hypothetical protein